ncbi:hypothetical protein FD04_GL001750 [Secundilactobacillus odoratitofui DSM 19909 = JCM 15043]|uniref:Uncharacterized protein n=1 Tax=Secundilactobacillus odoratitofui DSM 19909 = JCM 15043 TaxID=1423776 RepID=A0A0R1LX93_9LACO|nr:hypothetical protein [Secundilactobacillus odoratitofui]KRK96898.1 hypothetical protein FD04_GL001750 [Secundilactobacillus odoratitofui DSM 19909 = JCM 15043]
MSEIRAQLINSDQAHALLKEQHTQANESFPELTLTGQYILPDYRLTRKREAFKIRKHIFLKKHYKSYVAFDSENGQTLWMHNFSSLTQALFWLQTGLKPGDTDSQFTFKDWQDNHADEIEEFKDQLRDLHKARLAKKKALEAKQAAHRPKKKATK